MTYWDKRKSLKYYMVVRRWLEELDEQDSILDIGYRGTPVAKYGNFKKRYALDKNKFSGINGVECIYEDWLLWETDKEFSVITCLQLLEHLSDDEVNIFSSKIFSHSKISIISVPYNWPIEFCKHHLQDPINIHKFLKITGRDPKKIEIIRENDGVERLVAFFISV